MDPEVLRCSFLADFVFYILCILKFENAKILASCSLWDPVFEEAMHFITSM